MIAVGAFVRQPMFPMGSIVRSACVYVCVCRYSYVFHLFLFKYEII